MVRRITWSLGSEGGRTNTSFNTKVIGPALNFLGNYWDIAFDGKLTGGRIQFLFANPPRADWAAWTNGFTCRISSTYNFNVGPTRDVLCAYVIAHEFGHMVRQGNIHSSSLGLMHPNCNMPAGNLYQADYPWFDAYPRKPGAKRPHEEPGRFKAAFMPNVAMAQFGQVEAVQEIQFGCNHEPVKRAWYDFRPESWLRP